MEQKEEHLQEQHAEMFLLAIREKMKVGVFGQTY